MQLNHPPSYEELGLHISPSLWKRIVHYYEVTYIGVIQQAFPIEEFAKQRLIAARSQIQRLETLKVSKKKKCLDAGCGLGTFVSLALKAGYNYYGYEIDDELITIGQKILKENNLPIDRIMSWTKLTKHNHIPQFDFISSFEVVEHVDNTLMYIRDVNSVLSPEGRFFVEAPNYLIPYEVHFYVFMPLFLPRQMKWMICTLMGRTNKKFFDELNFITANSLEGAFKNAGFRVVNLGKKEWVSMIKSENMQDRSIYLVRILRILKALKLIPFVIFLAKNNLYSPLVYTASHTNT